MTNSINALLAEVQDSVASSQKDTLAAVEERFRVPPCRFGMLLEQLDQLDKLVLDGDQSAQIKHWFAEASLKALVREGVLGCKKCACCARYTSHHHLCRLSPKISIDPTSQKDIMKL